MYIILVYDVDEKRVNKIHNICRKYLKWKQRSVFEGDISLGKYNILKMELSSVLREDDYVIIYILKSEKDFKREILGNIEDEYDYVI
jgi:CRISPR-associated protein Cas2